MNYGVHLAQREKRTGGEIFKVRERLRAPLEPNGKTPDFHSSHAKVLDRPFVFSLSLLFLAFDLRTNIVPELEHRWSPMSVPIV